MNTYSPTDRAASSRPDDGWHIADLFALVWRQRILIGGTVALVVAIALIAAFTITPRYMARATFMSPPEEGGGNISAYLRNPLGAVLKRGGGASVDRLVSFLNSETTLRLIVERFNLQQHYEKQFFTYAIKALESATTSVVTAEGTIVVTVTDRDPVLAAEIANAYVDITDSLYREAETRHAGQLRRFLEARVQENRDELTQGEVEARDFALRHGVVSLPDQVTALVDQMAKAEGEIRALDVKIGATRQILGPDHYTLREMTIEREQLLQQRNSLTQSRGRDSGDPLLSFRDVPELALEYARLDRKIKMLSLVQQLLVQEYEMARLDELRTVSWLTRVDRATPPEIRSWPRRGRIVILSGVVSVVWGVLLAMFVEAWPGMKKRFALSYTRFSRRSPSPQESAPPDRGAR